MPNNLLLFAVLLHFGGTILLALTIAKTAAIMRVLTASCKKPIYFLKSKHSLLSFLLILGSLGYLGLSIFFAIGILLNALPANFLQSALANFISLIGSVLILCAMFMFSKNYLKKKRS